MHSFPHKQKSTAEHKALCDLANSPNDTFTYLLLQQIKNLFSDLCFWLDWALEVTLFNSLERLLACFHSPIKRLFTKPLCTYIRAPKVYLLFLLFIFTVIFALRPPPTGVEYRRVIRSYCVTLWWNGTMSIGCIVSDEPKSKAMQNKDSKYMLI